MRYLIRVTALVVLLAGICWVAGCSVSAGLSGNSIVITPSSSRLFPGGSQTFAANMPVEWSVKETGGGNITQSGLYIAPVATGTFHVVATRLDDAAKEATATVTVTPGSIVSGLTANPLADAAVQGFPDGANLVRWPFLSSRVLAYFVYRDTNPLAPTAVAPGSIFEYVDSAGPLPQLGAVMETVEVDIEIDPQTGVVDRFELNTSYDPSTLDLHNAEMNLGEQSLHMACRRVPLTAGDTCGYRLRVLYMDYDTGGLDDPGGFPAAYRLYLGNLSDATARVTLTRPPELTSPGQGQFPIDGLFRATQSPGAWNYIVQVSSGSAFGTAGAYAFNATPNGASVEGYLDPVELFNRFAGFAGQPLYWRIGARADTGPLPAPLSDPNQSGWVFSPFRFFTLPPFPPPPG